MYAYKAEDSKILLDIKTEFSVVLKYSYQFSQEMALRSCIVNVSESGASLWDTPVVV